MNRIVRRRRRPLALALLGLGLALATPAAATAPAGPLPDQQEVRRLVLLEAERVGMPPALALALAKVQSDFQANALSSRGARGVLQIMPETARDELRIDPDELWDARLNIEVGLDWLERLFGRYGSWEAALGHYHAGRVLGEGATAAPLPESRDFVDLVLRWRDRYAAQSDLWTVLRAREDRFTPARSDPRRPPAPIATAAPVAEPAPVARAEPRYVVILREPAPEPQRYRLSSPAEDRAWLDIDSRRAIVRARLDDFSPPYQIHRRR